MKIRIPELCSSFLGSELQDLEFYSGNGYTDFQCFEQWCHSVSIQEQTVELVDAKSFPSDTQIFFNDSHKQKQKHSNSQTQSAPKIQNGINQYRTRSNPVQGLTQVRIQDEKMTKKAPLRPYKRFRKPRIQAKNGSKQSTTHNANKFFKCRLKDIYRQQRNQKSLDQECIKDLDPLFRSSCINFKTIQSILQVPEFNKLLRQKYLDGSLRHLVQKTRCSTQNRELHLKKVPIMQMAIRDPTNFQAWNIQFQQKQRDV